MRHSSTRWALVPTIALALGSAVLSPGPASAADHQSRAQWCSSVDVIGHRGTSYQPARTTNENTIAGFNLAVRGGADSIETDVWLSKDGVPFIMHDSTLDRTTPYSGVPRNFTSAQLSRMHTNSGNPIPTMAKAIKWAARHKVRMYIETKENGIDWTSFYRTIASYDAQRYITFYDGSYWRMVKAKKAEPRLTYGLKSWVHHTPQAAAQVGRFETSSASMLKGDDAATDSFIASIRRAGMRVVVRMSHSPRQWKGFKQNHVDGVVVDNPATFRSWCRS